MTTTILRLGSLDPLTDTFGAHPLLGAPLDLNDGATFTLANPAGLELPPPPRTVVTTGNMRAQGERGLRALYRHNREVTLRLILGQMASYSDVVAALRNLVAWLDGPPAIPVTLRYQPIGATTPLYLDVVGAAHDIPEDEAQWLRLQFEPITLTLICRPGLRGDRQTLDNLITNPGFEAPGGPAMPAFADTFASLNAYALIAGAAPTQNPARTYVDVIAADAPLRYHRLGEASGASAYDIGGNNQVGTYAASPTLGVAGAIAGDTDTAVTFNGTTQYASVPATGLPTGNAPWSLEAWVKLGANPAANAVAVAFGNMTTHAAPSVYIDTSGRALTDTGGAANNSGPSAALSLNTWHHLVGTWDGTTVRIYVDGALGSSGTPGAMALSAVGMYATVGAQAAASPGLFFPGSIDEVAIYGTTLSAGQVSAHYTAGHTGATGTVASAMALAAGGQVAFGSPAWGPLNLWQMRFRWVTGLTATYYLHYTDANNSLRCVITGTALALRELVGGVDTLIASVGVTLTHEAWYWVQVTQFPSVATDPSAVQATLLADSAGAVGAQVAMVGPAPTVDAVTALAGRPQIAASGATLVLGGPYAGAHTVGLFGPGGWLTQNATQNAGTGVAAGAWEQASANTYPGGPVVSQGAARLDAAPAGTLDASWRLYTGGAPAGTAAIPIASSPATLSLAGAYKTSGVGPNAQIVAQVSEYDTNGVALRSGPALTMNGGTGGLWRTLSATYTTAANTAYVDIAWRVVDTTSGSAGGTFWLDNLQCWNQAALGVNQTTMPYCELRFPQAPAQLLVSGLLGDLPAPAHLALGAYLANWPKGATLPFLLGRRLSASANARLVGGSYGYYGTALTPQSVAVLDAASYGGYVVQATVAAAGWNPRAFSPTAADAPGAYHLLARGLTQQITANLANVQVRASTQQRLQPWFGATDLSDQLGEYYGPFAAPFAASAAWTVFDAGQVTLPPLLQGLLADPTQTYLTPRAQWADSSSGGALGQINWQALLPVDGSLLSGIARNPTNAPAALASRWFWVYVDGLATALGQPAAWLYSVEAQPAPNAAHAGGGPGATTTGVINVTSGADPYLTLDPQVYIAGSGGAFGANLGVNQLVVSMTDNAAATLPVACELRYAPLYLYPR